MICTVTFNPSLDYIVSVDNFRTGCTNRATEELLVPGGKGINVSMVLANLGIDSTALGFTAGFVGEEIERGLERIGVKTDFIRLEQGVSRINLKLRSVEGTEINGRGPKIPPEAVEALFRKLDGLREGDILFLSGSVPPSLSDDIYRKIAGRLEGKGVLLIVDAAGKLLTETLAYRPFLIKPNNHELTALFDVELASREDVLPYGRKLCKMGARNVLISLAGEGAVLLAEDGSFYETPAPEGEFVNGTGAGDAMVAGFVAGWLRYKDYRKAFYMGVAAGSASAFSEHFADAGEIERLYEKLL